MPMPMSTLQLIMLLCFMRFRPWYPCPSPHVLVGRGSGFWVLQSERFESWPLIPQPPQISLLRDLVNNMALVLDVGPRRGSRYLHLIRRNHPPA